jgi:signal transduction histidine kinase
VYATAIQSLSGLAAARHDWAQALMGKPAANYETLSVDTYVAYSTIVDALIAGTAQVPQEITDSTLRDGVEALYASLQTTEYEYQTVFDMYQASWDTGTNHLGDVYQASQDWGTALAWTSQMASLGTGPYATAIGTLSGGMSQGVGQQSLVASSLQMDLGLEQSNEAPELVSVMEAFTQPINPAKSISVTATELGNSQIAAEVTSRANALHNQAVEQAALFGGIGAIGIVLGMLLVVLVSRSVSRPLVDLAHQAEELAHTTLPATVQSILDAGNGTEAPKVPKVSVHSRDEVGDMARALDAVNKTAIELASGQAALRRNLADAFVNLGRRNQNLVTRQLEYISEIELKEADPDSLEELFRLDHLATRMRRNAESLLILAGSGPARQWSAAVPAMDVARAASAEVEDYKRLRLHHFDPAMITGAVTTDLVHIMAELIENALSFSPPGSPVDVYGRFLEGGYVIVIVDSGIGMSAGDLETANRRLGGEGTDDEVPGRYLGHFVAGRLASRHDIAISLQSSHSGGLVARVKIPATLIEDAVPDLSAVAEVRGTPTPPAIEAAPQPGPTYLSPSGQPLPGPTILSAPGQPVSGPTILSASGQPLSAPSKPQIPTDDAAPPAVTDRAGSPAGADTDTGPLGSGPFANSSPSAPTPGADTDGSGFADAYAGTDGTDASYSDGGFQGGDSSWGGLEGELAQFLNAAAEEPEPDTDDAWLTEPEAEAEAHETLPSWSAAAASDFGATGGDPVADQAPAGPSTPSGLPRRGAAVPASPPDEAVSYDTGHHGTGGIDAASEPGGFTATVAPAAPAPAVPSLRAPLSAPSPVAPPMPPAPDLGILSPLAATTDVVPGGLFPGGLHRAAPSVEPNLAAPAAPVTATATSSAALWNSLPSLAEAPAVGPATQARSTADGLRKLTRRVPGAALPVEDDSLRRATPTTTTRNPLGLTGALSQYLSATASEGRPEKEHNSR